MTDAPLPVRRRKRGKTLGPATIHDVSAATGVSVRTVSLVLNDSPKVNAETRARVKEAIRTLNFVPNLRARALASNRSYLLGLVHDDPNAEIVDQFQKGVFRECAPHDYELLVHPCNYTSEDLIDNVLSFVRRSRIDGAIVIAPVSENEALAKALWTNGTPTAGVASVALESYGLIVVSREREASAEVGELFVSLGHREIGFISGPRVQRSATERETGFVLGLRKHGLSVRPENMCEGEYSFESGVACAKKILASKRRPTAIYASNDRMAAGVLKVAAEMGLRVPKDLSVVGFDDSYLASVLTPSLTTIHRPMTEMGARAAQWVLQAGDPRQASAEESLLRFFDLQLVIRESTGPAP